MDIQTYKYVSIRFARVHILRIPLRKYSMYLHISVPHDVCDVHIHISAYTDREMQMLGVDM